MSLKERLMGIRQFACVFTIVNCTHVSVDKVLLAADMPAREGRAQRSGISGI